MNYKQSMAEKSERVRIMEKSQELSHSMQRKKEQSEEEFKSALNRKERKELSE